MPSYTRLTCLLLGLVLLLASCSSAIDQGGAVPTSSAALPTAAPRPTAAPQPEATAAPQATQLADTAAATPVPAVAGETFVVPASQGAALPARALPNALFGTLDIEPELRAFFEQVYRARTIERGVKPSADALRGLVDGAYADYTIPLFEGEVADANDGKLLAASFSDLNVGLAEWKPAADGLSGTALVSVTRTRTAVRTDRQEAPQTATYQFRAERRRSGDNGVAWVATDFLNPATNRWISEPITTPQQAANAAIQDFFKRFYAARTLVPGGKFDIDTIVQLTQLAYQDYTLPLLSEQQSEADAGKLTAVEYTDLKVEVLDYDPRATNHGGVATVQVTRTARVRRPGGAETPQTATYRFRLHDHHDESGKIYWLAVDFFQPQAGRWVSEIAGMAVSVPSAGHG